MPATVMLLDTATLYFRAFFGLPQSLVGTDGMPVNAVRGLLDFIARLVADHRPGQLVACMDADWRPAFRVAALPSYKAHRVGTGGRETVPEALAAQVPVIERVLDAVGIARAEVAGYEADDVIGTLASTAGRPVDVVTGDRDLFQLVRDEAPVRVIYTAKGVARPVLVDDAELGLRYGVSGRSYADFAILRGDPSDGLPGVPGVGDKTASALLARFGGLDAALTALDAGEIAGFPAGIRPKLAAARDYLGRAAAVVRVACDLTVPPHDPSLPRSPADPATLVELSNRYRLDSPLNRLLAVLARTPAEGGGRAEADTGGPAGRSAPARPPGGSVVTDE